ncbi:SDR family oxidoreductase [Lyngbya confervoides]|uniref:SDR family oxidoreductase n=1 Tax=Lyngbya confervoides BDU141951 TaxID=1574623 RepID=A0ABD4T010_9CYAN|nr:SDR family oxidoreductase [Lyngbya confervoides]MCM1981969.1 SDR family oxidoreductase [Lyngbya confervoides BDU141951]
MTRVKGQSALITGASRGIGRASAIAFAKAGYRIGLISRNQSALEAVAQEIHHLGGEAVVMAMDLTEVSQIPQRLTAFQAELGEVEVLVNNAGMAYTGALAEMPLEQWQQLMTLNLTSVFQCIQSILPQMRHRQRGTIVNVISVAGKQAFPDWGAYCASKFGLMGLTKSLAQEERTHGIRVIAFCPGAVNTPLWDTDTVDADFDRAAMLTPSDVAQAMVQTVTLPHHAVVEEIVLMPNAGTF